MSIASNGDYRISIASNGDYRISIASNGDYSMSIASNGDYRISIASNGDYSMSIVMYTLRAKELNITTCHCHFPRSVHKLYKAYARG